MPALTRDARVVLDQMEPDHCYSVVDLRGMLPDASAESLGEVMHELWVHRQVERVGQAGWRRHRSSPVDDRPARGGTPKVVKPEDLFDHGSFEDFFR